MVPCDHDSLFGFPVGSGPGFRLLATVRVFSAGFRRTRGPFSSCEEYSDSAAQVTTLERPDFPLWECVHCHFLQLLSYCRRATADHYLSRDSYRLRARSYFSQRVRLPRHVLAFVASLHSLLSHTRCDLGLHQRSPPLYYRRALPDTAAVQLPVCFRVT